MSSTIVETAETMITEALQLAYEAKTAPDNVLHFLQGAETPGRMGCIFFSGRSGSYFAQSFFEGFSHPQVLTAHPAGLASYEHYVTDRFLAASNVAAEGSGLALQTWCDTLLGYFATMYAPVPTQPGWDSLCAPEALFRKLVYAQLLLTQRGNLTHERLIKLLMIAYRLARGGPLQCDGPLAYIWQAHTPSKSLKLWIRQKFGDPILLTVVRYPEKALDSHLVHHAFETVAAPTSTLLRRLLFEHMAANSDLIAGDSDATEYAVRFEDLHHHTQTVMQAICALLRVPFRSELCQNSFSMQALDRNVTGVRKLTPDEFSCKLLNHYDRLKVRFLLQEEYRIWGYSDQCEHGLQSALQSYRRDEIARNCPFGVQGLLADLERSDGSWSTAVDIERQMVTALRLQLETQRLRDLFVTERKRRDQGIKITPLLYSLENLVPR